MSYDYAVMKLLKPVTSARELGPDTVATLGSADSVRVLIDEVVEGLTWNGDLGTLTTEEGWIEFGVYGGDDVQCVSVGTSLRNDDRAWEVGILQKLLAAHGWVAYDVQTNRFVNSVADVGVDGCPSR
jgi:hypothetical protein